VSRRREPRRRKQPPITIGVAVAKVNGAIDSVVDTFVRDGQVRASTAPALRALLGLLVSQLPVAVDVELDDVNIHLGKSEAQAIGLASIASYASSLAQDELARLECGRPDPKGWGGTCPLPRGHDGSCQGQTTRRL
jgi:hypothetical protein